MNSDEVKTSQSIVMKQTRPNSGQVHTGQPVILLFEHAHVCWPGAHVRWLSTNVLAGRAHMCVGRATFAGRTHMSETQANEFG